jgi:hypothetical protein
MVPEIDGKIGSFEETMRNLKTQGGALSRAQILTSIGVGEKQKGRNNATVLRMKEQHSDMEESLKLCKAKLEHFGAQRALMIACQGASRDFAVLLDLWRASGATTVVRTEAASYFLVSHVGSKWMDGENQMFVHREVQGMRVKEFLEKLSLQYAGLEAVAVEATTTKTQAPRKAGVAYLLVSLLRRDEQGNFQHEIPYHKEGSSEQWKQRLT